MKSHRRGSHQPVAVESGVYTPKEEPARPQVLQSEFKDEICQQHQRPHHHKLQEGVRTANTQMKSITFIIIYKPSAEGCIQCVQM